MPIARGRSVGGIAQGVFGYAILFEYAVTAVPLLIVRRWSVPMLVALALAVPSYYPLREAAVGAYQWSTMGLEGANAAYRAPLARPFEPSRDQAALRNATRAAQNGTSFAAFASSSLRQRWNGLLEWPSVFRAFDVRTLGLFLIGVLALRLGVFERPAGHRPLILAAMLFGAANWTCFRLGWLAGPWSFTGIPDRITDAAVAFENGWLVRFPGQFLAFTYVGAILLLVSCSPAWERRLAWLAAAGRMALTNMGQVVIISVAFSTWGLGWTGLPREFAPAVGVCLFAGLTACSRIWLRSFRFGPAEWILRSISNGRFQSLMRNQSSER